MYIFRFDPPDYSTSQQQYGLSGLGIGGGGRETKTTNSSQQKLSKHSAFGNPVSSSSSTWERQSESKTSRNSGYGYSKKRWVCFCVFILIIICYSSQGSDNSSDAAQTRFGGAKSISSDQYFDKDRVEVSKLD